MKWLGRDEWRDAFEAALDRHLLPSCKKAGVEVEEVISILDRNQFMMTVWGCAFEDFLTRELDDGRNIVDDYLKRRGWKENASTRSYMSALRTHLEALLHREIVHIRIDPSGTVDASAVRPSALLCGSFNPFHIGHERLAEIATRPLRPPDSD